MGEISTQCYVDILKLVRNVLNCIGYSGLEQGFDGNTCVVSTSIDEQSPDIELGVNNFKENKCSSLTEEDLHGYGDQGMMFAYACDETLELMPLPISLVHKLAKQLAKVLKSSDAPCLRPDGKTQMTVEYEYGIPKRIDTIIVSAQHQQDMDMDMPNRDIIEKVITPIIPKDIIDTDPKYRLIPPIDLLLVVHRKTLDLQAEKLL